MATLQRAARTLLKELSRSTDEWVIQAAKCLEWASRRKNPAAARMDIKEAYGALLQSPVDNIEQMRSLNLIEALLHPAKLEDRKDWDWCAICGKDAVRYYKPHHSKLLFAVCARHAQPHLRAQDLAMIHKAMAAPDPALLDVLERESAAYLYLEDLDEATMGWAEKVPAWWKKVSESEGVVEAWRRLVDAAPDSSYHPDPIARDQANALALRGFVFQSIQKQLAEADKRASQRNGRKGGRPPTATVAQARQVRRLAAQGVPQVKIAEQVGLSRSHVVRLLRTFK